MKTVHFTARLLADAVISERAATTGGHRSLDYIPGATFLGAAAARLYASLGADAFRVFHSGRVRFGNAYPLTQSGEPALPVPLAWHATKGEDLGGSVRSIKNLSKADKEKFDEWDKKGEQQKQLRSGYFTPGGAKVDTPKNYRLKTAIDRDRQGMADDAQLFGYQSLAAGSHWYFGVSFDDDVPQNLVDEVTSALEGTVRVGRSRSAEYGLLATRKVDVGEMPFTPDASKLLIIYCLSDLALYDRVTGSPVLTPEADHFLAEGQAGEVILNLNRSYIRIRGYAPFNNKRSRFDTERQVITKGSVLIFEKKEGEFSADELSCLQTRISSGVGLYRQDGLGQVLVNPPFLADFEFTEYSSPKYMLIGASERLTPPALAGWLKEKAEERKSEIDSIARVNDWIKDLAAGPCPKNNQWGQLRTIAIQGKDMADILAMLSRLCADGNSTKQWIKKVRVNGKSTTYADFIFESLLDAKKVTIDGKDGQQGREEYRAGDSVTLEAARRNLYLLGNLLPRAINSQNGGEH